MDHGGSEQPGSASELPSTIVQITAWSTDRAATPQTTVHPAGTPDDALPEGHVIDKTHSRIVLIRTARGGIDAGQVRLASARRVATALQP